VEVRYSYQRGGLRRSQQEGKKLKKHLLKENKGL
jgi:hypothetical protein